ncbi:aldose epimerase family protein [Sphingosinicella sp. LHD-64]|uniref:aldose epimerase family protein n=1 Tax=Sphingosinicella sp. LHD-64 TaxID=3072139 RepID=UPI00280ED3E8|nr:aldose epimerase family protein [Sphingosinicella sp. LHD-64]MDQ8755188.1 aldose epimerase family protein [Sphingosinicella sp. LHD-64]
MRGALMALASWSMATQALAAEATRGEAGRLSDGTPVEAVTLRNANGIEARILTYGATLQRLIAPDRNGRRADVTLGHDDVESYVRTPNYFGVTVGRYANRIAGGRFTLDGRAYQLTLNDGPNSLHGGTQGFDKRNWTIRSVENGPTARVVLGLVSPDGDQGYPGRLDVTVTYALDERNDLTVSFEARTDRPTIVNMTNHALFNLAGEGAPEGTAAHRLTIPARAYTPVDERLIPTGELRAVDGTVFDFRTPRAIAAGLRDGRDPQIRIGRGYDHNFALDKGVTRAPELAARLEDPGSGRVLEVLSTEPGLQFYSGNFLDGTLVGKSGHVYRMGDGIALEPQKFPDAPNQPRFVPARVDPDAPYRHVMIYRLSTAR